MNTILYIEDDETSRRLIERVLEFAGYQVIAARTGLEGIDTARSAPPDLVLTDINLPDLNGNEVASVLRADERFANIPIVALTAESREGQDIGFAAGLTGYLTKPLDPDTLVERIKGYLAGHKDRIDPMRMDRARGRLLQSTVKRLEQRIRALEQANDSLAKLDRMKEMFIQITAHELRTPLTLIFGYSRLLEDYPPLTELKHRDPKVESLVVGLVDAIERMHTIIDEIVIISRVMTQQMDLAIEEVNLEHLARKVVKKFAEPLAERDLTLDFVAAGWPRSMRADADLLRLALDNLISNAIKYTPDGGTITLSAETVGQQVKVRVRDTGIGIDAAEQVRIFEEFHTISDVELHSTSKTAFGGGGLGLGLPVCKGIVEAHGGTLTVTSTGHDPDTLPGSIFEMVLPLDVREVISRQ